MNILIRPETTTDFDRIADVVTRAFKRPGVAELIRHIRASDNYVPGLSLVAERDGQIIGHIMQSYVTLEDGSRRHKILTLSPLAVDPQFHKQGIGSQLVREAIRRADERGESLIVLEGRPEYYTRFGFRPSYQLDIEYPLPDWAPAEAGQALPLSGNSPALAPKGKVVYPEYFKLAEH
ncbi:MAG TPA: N-acetyltransferase [Candidatus Saccharimonadia bacterium]|nr:N-acetyltransferase [Candidatus Saccharimonadia bacterium]